jgi:hypothetical protein
MLFQLPHIGRIAMKSAVFRVITFRISEITFGGTYGLHHQGRRLVQLTNPRDGGVKKSSVSCLFFTYKVLGLFFNPEDGDDMFFRNIRPKTVPFIVTAVRNSDPEQNHL